LCRSWLRERGSGHSGPAEEGHVSVARLLLGHGVNVFSRDAVRGSKALDWAVQGAMTGVVKILEHLMEGGFISLLEVQCDT
jgi:hypothetical protein